MCTRFMTVLGPGSDGYHEDHIHMDLAERRSAWRSCHWDVRDPEQLDGPSLASGSSAKVKQAPRERAKVDKPAAAKP